MRNNIWKEKMRLILRKTKMKATDLTFANKLKQHLKTNSCFKGERGRAFRVNHYVGEVLYDTNGFLEKNRDPLPADLINLLSSCDCQLLKLFSTKMRDKSQKPLMLSDSTNQTVGTKFKGQLFKLMIMLENTSPHFIRCIKPNLKQLPRVYEEGLVLQQLRCCGVLEVVRISRSGYPTRLTHQEFAGRYGFGSNIPEDGSRLIKEVNDLDDEAFDDDSVYVRDDCEGLLVVD